MRPRKRQVIGSMPARKVEAMVRDLARMAGVMRSQARLRAEKGEDGWANIFIHRASAFNVAAKTLAHAARRCV